MRLSALILIVVAISGQAAPAGPQDKASPAPKKNTEGSANKVRELQKERITTLKELVDQATAEYQSARASYEEVIEAQLLLLKAEVDVAEKAAERIALYKKAVDGLTALEEIANSRVKSGRGTQGAVLKIKARRLEVEIQLEQAKIKEAKESK